MDAIQGFNILTDKLAGMAGDYGFIFEHKLFSFFAIIIVTLIFSKVLELIIEKIVQKLAGKTKTDIDDRIIAKTKGPVYYLFLTIGFYIAFIPLGFPEAVMGYLQKIAGSIAIILITLIVIRVADILINSWGSVWASKTESTLDDELLPIFHKFSKIVFSIFGVLAIFSAWGINITGLLAGVGIAGIAIGFAVKDSLANIFGGISLILDKAFKVGDKIKVESGETGVVEDVGLRSTRLKTYDNEIILIPNGQLANSKIQNFVLPDPKVRIKVNFGVEYGSNPDRVKKVVLKAASGIKKVMKSPEPLVEFLEMGDSSLKFVCKLWVDDYRDGYQVQLEATDKIYKALNKAKIGIPFPTHTVHIKK
ncbi:MAG: mechanosensitive ion channel family protein [Candidatus Woesearchaeota archaeon]